MYQSVKITKGKDGVGGPIIIKPTDKKNKIISVTGGGIDPLAERIASLTGCEAVDGFTTGVSDEEILCAVINCGGTARCGVYPRKNIPAINTTAVGASGPLAKYMVETLYVSDVKIENIEVTNEEGIVCENIEVENKEETIIQENILVKMGKTMGNAVNIMFQSGREAIDMVIKTILPFMAFVSMIIGIVKGTGLGDLLANTIAPFAGSLPGLIVISAICAIPIISPIIGPGAVIAQVVGVLIGEQIGRGAISPSLSLPALFAIDAQVGADFIPVGLSLGEAEPNTISYGVPAILFSRLITGPIAVVVAYLFSFGMY